MQRFFSRLSYSFGNEDWTTERRALQLKPQDRVVCITASGDRPLNLLLDDLHELVSVDANPSQNHLLHLKMAALSTFDYGVYLAFLGARPHTNRLSLLPLLLPEMPAQSAHFWSAHSAMIAKGVLYQGKVERFCALIAPLIAVLRGKKLDRLFAFNELEEQRRFVREEWDTAFWRGVLDVCLHPWITRLFVQDPGLYSHLGQGIKPSTYIQSRMTASLSRTLAKENLLISLALRGHVSAEAFSPYLKEKESATIKQRLSKILPVHADIHTFLEGAPVDHFDAFSLSDVASFISKEQFHKLLKEIIRTAKSGARFCIRQFLSDYHIPRELTPYFHRDTTLERGLEEEDSCFVYRYMTGNICK